MNTEQLRGLTALELLTELERQVKMAKELCETSPLWRDSVNFPGRDRFGLPLLAIGDFDIWPRRER